MMSKFGESSHIIFPKSFYIYLSQLYGHKFGQKSLKTSFNGENQQKELIMYTHFYTKTGYFGLILNY